MKENKKQIISIFKKLKKFDTPTICNALELIDPKLQGKGFTTLPHVTLNKSLSPIMGYARTATIVSSVKKSKLSTLNLFKLSFIVVHSISISLVNPTTL